MTTIYKNSQAKIDLMNLYNEKLKSLEIDYTELDIETSYGRTRVVKTGNPSGSPVVLFHGYNAGTPITLEPIKELGEEYQLIVIETLGQATKSEEVAMNIKDDSFAIWANEILENLAIKQCTIIGISYGAFIAGKLITHHSEKVSKCILIVPSGIVNGNFWGSTKKLTIPLIKWRITNKEKYLSKFLNAFIPLGDTFMYKMLSVMMKGIKLDTRIPKLLKAKNIKHFKEPVYVMAAENDIYFPGNKVLEKSKRLFVNLKETHTLKKSNHMPSKESFIELQMTLAKWLK